MKMKLMAGKIGAKLDITFKNRGNKTKIINGRLWKCIAINIKAIRSGIVRVWYIFIKKL